MHGGGEASGLTGLQFLFEFRERHQSRFVLDLEFLLLDLEFLLLAFEEVIDGGEFLVDQAKLGVVIGDFILQSADIALQLVDFDPGRGDERYELFYRLIQYSAEDGRGTLAREAIDGALEVFRDG